MNGAADGRFESFLLFLQQSRGFDFTGYKRPSLIRRVMRRMQVLGLSDFDAYADYLQVHPDEFALLFNTILINVTSFFRDAYAWEYIESTVLPALLSAKAAHEPVRVWSAGCASGQEAYSIAMLLAEALGVDAFRDRVKVYATDADEEALGQARRASYSAREVEDIPPQLLKRYFEPLNTRHLFRSDLRRCVIFGRHDLLSDAPISRLDLLICRNTLMYFNAETQGRILQRFHFALNGHDGKPGYLFLGRAEMMLAQGQLFSTKDLICRVFLKMPLPGARARAPLPKILEPNVNASDMTANERLRDVALHDSPDPRILVDANGKLALANHKARLIFRLNPKDVGRPLQDLEISYRPIELRALIEQSYAERRPVVRSNVERHFPDGETHYLDVIVTPLFDESHSPLGASVAFVDVTRSQRLQEELQRSREEIQTANEELQSSNEELETTNEELQSTNEELETMNEELQSTNEELQTVNEELRQRTDELNQSNAFLHSVLASMRGAAIVVNADFNVLVWNHRAEELWGLRQDEVQGKSVLNLDIGLPVGGLRAPMRACLHEGAEHKAIELDAVNRRGKAIRCRIACTPLLAADKRRDGVILMMDEVQ